MKRLFTILLFALGMVSSTASAHQTGQSTFVAHVMEDSGKVDTLLTCPATDVAHGAGVDRGDDGLYDPAELQSAWQSLGFYLDRRIEVTNDGEPCEVIEHKMSPGHDPTGFWFLKAFQCEVPLGVVELRNDAMVETTGGYRHIGKIQVGDDVHTTVFNRETPSFTVEPTADDPRPSLWETMGRFVWEGMLHIVFGLDHVLFVLGLVLLSRRLKQLLVVVTAFTLAHSVTLALSALDVVTISPSVIEPIIALSIAWVAVEAVLDRKDARTVYVATFVLGLVHGFGFSYVLRDEVGLPADALLPALLSFNLGVEVGQLGIVALVYPIRAWVRERDWERRAVVGLAISIGIVALYWFVERTFLA